MFNTLHFKLFERAHFKTNLLVRSETYIPKIKTSFFKWIVLLSVPDLNNSDINLFPKTQKVFLFNLINLFRSFKGSFIFRTKKRHINFILFSFLRWKHRAESHSHVFSKVVLRQKCFSLAHTYKCWNLYFN